MFAQPGAGRRSWTHWSLLEDSPHGRRATSTALDQSDSGGGKGVGAGASRLPALRWRTYASPPSSMDKRSVPSKIVMPLSLVARSRHCFADMSRTTRQFWFCVVRAMWTVRVTSNSRCKPVIRVRLACRSDHSLAEEFSAAAGITSKRPAIRVSRIGSIIAIDRREVVVCTGNLDRAVGVLARLKKPARRQGAGRRRVEGRVQLEAQTPAGRAGASSVRYLPSFQLALTPEGVLTFLYKIPAKRLQGH